MLARPMKMMRMLFASFPVAFSRSSSGRASMEMRVAVLLHHHLLCHRISLRTSTARGRPARRSAAAAEEGALWVRARRCSRRRHTAEQSAAALFSTATAPVLAGKSSRIQGLRCFAAAGISSVCTCRYFNCLHCFFVDFSYESFSTFAFQHRRLSCLSHAL